jgi:DNA-binding transcriptional MerR regulator
LILTLRHTIQYLSRSNEMTKTYRVKAFSELTSTTVRTLQYYDKIDLLKPSAKTSSGHRLYSESDLSRLQQITALKFMGFKLNDIRRIQAATIDDTHKALELQSQILEEQMDTLSQGLRLTEQALRMLKREEHVDWQIYAKITEVLKMKQVDSRTWAKKIFTADELQQFEALRGKYSDEYIEEYGKRWEAIWAEAKSKVDLDPASPEAQDIARRWMALVNEVYGDNTSIRGKLWQTFKAGSAPEDMPYFDQDTVDFIDKALHHLSDEDLNTKPKS